jgi:hypothetical protein
MKRNLKWATDHRALVLESVATNPRGASAELIIADCASETFQRAVVKSMIWQLRAEGLIGRDDAGTGHFITKAGLDWLTHGRFDRALPAPHTRPGRQRRKPTL